MEMTHTRYGRLSRALHWAMAALFAWQFASVGARVLLPDSPLDEFLWATHKPLGALLLMLGLLRLAWALWEHPRRPAALNGAARLGHLALYALMLAIPALALLRQFGSGRAFSPFGLPLMPGFDGEIEWMTALGSALHGLLGWTLLVLLVGHITMALLHGRLGGQPVLRRMT